MTQEMLSSRNHAVPVMSNEIERLHAEHDRLRVSGDYQERERERERERELGCDKVVYILSANH